ncbi:MAG: hypothetical protein U0T77_03520 [Chitinophagales bacterium]
MDAVQTFFLNYSILMVLTSSSCFYSLIHYQTEKIWALFATSLHAAAADI